MKRAHVVDGVQGAEKMAVVAGQAKRAVLAIQLYRDQGSSLPVQDSA